MENCIDILIEILKEIRHDKIANFTMEECSEYMNVSIAKIRELINKHNTDFPYFKNGSKNLVNKELLDAWLKKVVNEHRTI